jgi:hypothetical protein
LILKHEPEGSRLTYLVVAGRPADASQNGGRYKAEERMNRFKPVFP